MTRILFGDVQVGHRRLVIDRRRIADPLDHVFRAVGENSGNVRAIRHAT